MLSAAPAVAAFAGAMARAAARARPLPRRSFRVARRTGARAWRAALCGRCCRAICASSSGATTGCSSTATARSSRRPARCCASRQIAKFADRAAALRAHLAAKGARLLVAIPPNGATINRARLPAWAAEAPAVTEYDLMMRALGRARRRRGRSARRRCWPRTPSTDLPAHRHALEQVRRAGRLQRGGAAPRASPTGPSIPRACCAVSNASTGGDLARLLAVSADVSDEDAVIDLSRLRSAAAARQRRSRRSSKAAAIWSRPAAPGRRCVVIGDFVHARLLAGLFRRCTPAAMSGCTTSCAASGCRVVDEYAPELVILAPTERQMFCAGG